MSDAVKARLLALIAERKTDLATVSKAIGKNHAYLGQFIRRNVPRRLPEEVRESLGRHFGVDPDTFRSHPAPTSSWTRNGARLDPGKLRRAMMVAEKVVGSRALEDRGAVVVEIASAVYDVLAEKEAEGRPIDDDDALRAIEAILRRIHQPRGG